MDKATRWMRVAGVIKLKDSVCRDNIVTEPISPDSIQALKRLVRALCTRFCDFVHLGLLKLRFL